MNNTTKLNQIIAVENGTKSRTARDLTDAYHVLQKPTLMSGISRTYLPDQEDGENFPAENSKVQVRASDLIVKTQSILTEMFDVVATKDQTNCVAKASVMVDNKVLLKDVPVTTLLFIEKQLVDINTFIKKIPVLDPSENWHHDSASDCYATDPTFTVKTKKTPQNHVKAPSTDKHPAQVEMWYEDKVVGKWKTIKFSGALPQAEITKLLDRVEKLQKAVKFAREEANSVTIVERKISKEIFDFLFN